MSERSPVFTGTIDMSQMDAESDRVQKTTAARLQASVGNIRRVAELTVAGLQAVGLVVDTSYLLAIQVGIRSVEFFTNLATLRTLALAGTPLGLFAIGQAVAQSGAIAALLITISNLQRGRTAAARLWRSGAMALQVLTWRG